MHSTISGARGARTGALAVTLSSSPLARLLDPLGAPPAGVSMQSSLSCTPAPRSLPHPQSERLSAENSNTARHLAEFWMIEPELAFADLEDDMAVAEAYLKHCTR